MLQELQKFLNLERWLKHKSFQNFAFLAIIQTTNVLIALIAIPIVVKAVNIEQFGLINLSLSFITLLNVVVNYGYYLSGPREVAIHASNKNVLSDIFSKIVIGKLLIASFLFVSVLALVNFTPTFDRYGTILLFSTIILFSEALFPSWIAQGLERLQIIVIGNVISKLLYIFLLIVFINSPAESKLVNFFVGLSALGVNIILIIYITSSWNIKLKLVSFKNILHSLKTNFILLLSTIISQITVSSGVIILSFFSDNKELGLYSLAEKVMLIIRMLPVLISQAIYPKASKLYLENQVKFLNFLNKVWFISIFFGTALSITTYLASPIIIYFLSKEHLETSIQFLKILSFVPLLASLNIINIIVFLSADQKDMLFTSSWILCIFMVISSSLLTYYFGGLGLCYALVTTEIVVFFVCTLLNYLRNKNLVIQFYKSIFISKTHSGQ